MGAYATSKKTKEALIGAAGQLFAIYGFHGISTRTIAEEAGENVGSIHYHFGSKSGLLEATYRAMFEVLENEPLDYMENRESLLLSDRGKIEFLVGLMEIYFAKIFRKDKYGWEAALFCQVLTQQDEITQKLFRETIRPELQVLKKIAKRLRPDFSEMEAEIWSVNFVGQIAHFSLLKPAICVSFDMEDYSETYLETLKRHLLKNIIPGLGLFLPPNFDFSTADDPSSQNVPNSH
jgi:AcrR family transcriptional regulator